MVDISEKETQEPAQDNNKRLSDCLEEYIAIKKHAARPWFKKLARKYRTRISCMIEMVGDPVAKSFEAEVLQKQFITQVDRLPLQWSTRKAFRDDNNKRKPIDEIIQMSDDANMQQLVDSSVQGYIKPNKKFLEWCVEHGYVQHSVLYGFE